MPKVDRFEDLNCWREARSLVRIVFEESNKGAMSKDYDMKSQIRRAAISSMNNIAEGFGRFSKKEFIRFLEISSASACEVKSLTYAATDLGYWPEDLAKQIQDRAENVKSLDLGFIRFLKTRLP